MPYSFSFIKVFKVLLVIAGSKWNSNIAWDLDVEFCLAQLSERHEVVTCVLPAQYLLLVAPPWRSMLCPTTQHWEDLSF